MNDSDQMMALFVAILVMIGLLYLLCRLIYVIVDEAWVAKNAREQQRVQEIRSAQQRSDLLAELREFGLSEEGSSAVSVGL